MKGNTLEQVLEEIIIAITEEEVEEEDCEDCAFNSGLMTATGIIERYLDY